MQQVYCGMQIACDIMSKCSCSPTAETEDLKSSQWWFESTHEHHMKESILISACLLGEKCRYDGRNCFTPDIEKLKIKYNLIPVCPEVLGGLTIPRNPAEQKGSRVFDNQGLDLTENFFKGSQKCLETAKANNCKIAILKTKSAACGVGQIYDGTFSGRLVQGNGVTVKLLLEAGIEVYTEKHITELL